MIAAWLTKDKGWTIAGAVFSVERVIKDAAMHGEKCLERQAMILLSAVKQGIAGDSLGLRPLAASTLKDKVKLGYSSTPIMRRGDLIKSHVKVWIKRGDEIFAGVPKGGSSSTSGYAGAGLAAKVAIYQHQTLNRPYMELAYEKVKDRLVKESKDSATRAILGRLAP